MDWSPQDNPIVQRAFRTGFRSGPSSFKVGWWLVGLALVTLGPFGMRVAVPGFTTSEAMRLMFFGLLILLGLAYLIGGFQRMISSFSKEREQGTFEFLQLSTLGSRQITFGFLLAGQLPGYLAMFFISPLVLIAAMMLEYSIVALAQMVISFLVLTLTLSVVFLYLGFWTKKASEFRGAAVVYIILYFFLGNIVLSAVGNLGVVPGGWGEIFLGMPVVFGYMMNLDGDSPVFDPQFFGVGLPPFLLLAIVLLPFAVTLYLALSRSLRHRERPPWTVVDASLLYGWLSVVFVGMWWAQGVPLALRVVSFSIVSYLLILTLLKRNSRSRGETVHDLGRDQGSWKQLLRRQPTSPLRLGLSLSLIYLVASWGLMLDGAGGKAPAIAFAVPLLLLSSIVATSVGHQWLRWRVPSWAAGLGFLNLVIVWLSFFVYANGHTMSRLMVPRDLLKSFGSISPFSQILGSLRDGTSSGWRGDGVAIYQAFFLLFAVFLLWNARGVAKVLSRQSRILLEGLDSDEEEAETLS